MTTRRAFLAAAGVAALAPLSLARAAVPLPALGRVVTLSVRSALVAARPVFVWLPDGYDHYQRRYPVLYMHDGETLFADAPVGAVAAPGIDEHVDGLAFAGAIRMPIIVAIGASPMRARELLPAAPVTLMPGDMRATLERRIGGAPLSDAYLHFVTSELKPLVDRHFRTLPGPADTAILGTGLAGLASLYALTQYPQVFSSAGCLSARTPLVAPASDGNSTAGEQATRRYLRQALPRAGAHRLYVDFGDIDRDTAGRTLHDIVPDAARAKGYVEGVDLVSTARNGAVDNARQRIDRTDAALTLLLQRPYPPREGRFD
ncbi:alpha/beta hydrolase-fold protein [Sphingomonas sp. AR_OL41]|uniref:alpha/beta hydrolase n=1 Tax=Sphingomonas sp. AR_OL41 TaxID=3042729 RepID=UPI00248002B3|nr:alpha/beta hydrolase-fold protein [Sphingomonas sp. AR_OL41]MDH7973114.1 alpha/beta hydrolase-fold protein [Sphingomonas sp. AR_OL41]